jgi:hypothetical protein
MTTSTLSESALRRKARQSGYTMTKSRWRKNSVDNLGEYQLIRTTQNLIVLGERWDASLADIEFFLFGGKRMAR